MESLRPGSTLWIVLVTVALGGSVGWGLWGSGGGAAWLAAAGMVVALVHHGRLWRTGRRPLPDGVRAVTGWDEVAAARTAPVALLFKHSPACPVSARALGQVWRFASSAPGLPILQLDVIRDRDLSRRVADALEVVHESPQVIVLRRGVVATVLNHGRIRQDVLRQAVASTGESEDG